jgi:hypothetical protein
MAAGLLSFVGVATLSATWDSTTDIDRLVSAASILFLYLPVLGWAFAEGGIHRACGLDHRSEGGRWRCRGDHGTERRASLALVVVTLVPVLVLVVQQAWEGAAAFSLIPAGFAVLASGFRSRPAWDAEVSRPRAERRLQG